MKPLLWLVLAGGAGTLARYLLSGLAQQVLRSEFPWGTLAVNSLGCILFGLLWAVSEEHVMLDTPTRLIVLTGFMGAFTTFSTFAFETSNLLRDSEWLLALANVAGQNLLGIVCVFIGVALSRLI